MQSSQSTGKGLRSTWGIERVSMKMLRPITFIKDPASCNIVNQALLQRQPMVYPIPTIGFIVVVGVVIFSYFVLLEISVVGVSKVLRKTLKEYLNSRNM